MLILILILALTIIAVLSGLAIYWNRRRNKKAIQELWKPEAGGIEMCFTDAMYPDLVFGRNKTAYEAEQPPQATKESSIIDDAIDIGVGLAVAEIFSEAVEAVSTPEAADLSGGGGEFGGGGATGSFD
jgi:hypothetical protein